MMRVSGKGERERKREERGGWEGKEGGKGRRKQWLGSQLGMSDWMGWGWTGECALRGGCSFFWTTGLFLVSGWWGLE